MFGLAFNVLEFLFFSFLGIYFQRVRGTSALRAQMRWNELNLYLQSDHFCSYMIRLNSKSFKKADIFFQSLKANAEIPIYSVKLPRGKYTIKVFEIGCAQMEVTKLHNQSLLNFHSFPFKNLSLSEIERLFPCSRRQVFDEIIEVQNENLGSTIDRTTCLTGNLLKAWPDLKILILGDSTTQDILKYFSMHFSTCRHVSFRDFEQHVIQNSTCVFFKARPYLVGIKLWTFYGDLWNTIKFYDVVIVNPGIHDIASPIDSHFFPYSSRVRKWVKQEEKDGNSYGPKFPYSDLGFGKNLPFKEKANPIMEYFLNINRLLKLFKQSKIPFFFVSTKFGRWDSPRLSQSLNNKICSKHPQRSDLIKVMNEYVRDAVGERHYLDLQRYSLASNTDEDSTFADMLHTDKTNKLGITFLKRCAWELAEKVCKVLRY